MLNGFFSLLNDAKNTHTHIVFITIMIFAQYRIQFSHRRNRNRFLLRWTKKKQRKNKQFVGCGWMNQMVFKAFYYFFDTSIWMLSTYNNFRCHSIILYELWNVTYQKREKRVEWVANEWRMNKFWPLQFRNWFFHESQNINGNFKRIQKYARYL